jgi:structural maintenance of chromosome 1
LIKYQGEHHHYHPSATLLLTNHFCYFNSSLDLKAEYDAASAALDKATETSVNQQGRRKGVNTEIKQYKEMKKEAERWKSLGVEKVSTAVSLRLPRQSD